MRHYCKAFLTCNYSTMSTIFIFFNMVFILSALWIFSMPHMFQLMYQCSNNPYIRIDIFYFFPKLTYCCLQGNFFGFFFFGIQFNFLLGKIWLNYLFQRKSTIYLNSILWYKKHLKETFFRFDNTIFHL